MAESQRSRVERKRRAQVSELDKSSACRAIDQEMAQIWKPYGERSMCRLRLSGRIVVGGWISKQNGRSWGAISKAAQHD